MTAREPPQLSPGFNIVGRPLSRTMADEDWDDARWARFLGSDPVAGAVRGAHEWERTHLLYGLNGCGRLKGSARILVAATMPDECIGALTEYACQVEVIELLPGSKRQGAEARLYWSNGGLYARDRLIVQESAAVDLQEAGYDAVVFPHGAICCAGVPGISRLMQKSEQLLVAGGVLAFKADILAGDTPHPDHLDAALVRQEDLVGKIESETGFTIDGGFDARFPWDSARAASSGADAFRGEAGRDGDASDRRSVPSLWFLRKRQRAPEGGWERMESWLTQRLLGDQLRALRLGPAGYRDGAGRIVANESVKGCVFFGPYLVLPGGRYEAIVEIEPHGVEGCGRVILDIAAGGRPLHRRNIDLVAGSSISARLPFELPALSLAHLERMEIRAWSTGYPVVFTGCQLRALAA